MAKQHTAGPDSVEAGHLPGLLHAKHVLEHWLSVLHTVHPEAPMNGTRALRCVIRERGDVISIVSLAGTIDCATAHTLGSTLHECIRKGRHVILSMAGVTGMDCAGAAILVQAVAAARYRSLGFSLVAVSREVEAALELYHLKSLIPEYRHVADARRQICRASSATVTG